MIIKLHVENFKRFKNQTFEFKPYGVTLLAGGNNSGKSSVLQALNIWDFAYNLIMRKRGRKSVLSGSLAKSGVGLSAEDFAPVTLPDLKHLWTNLTTVGGSYSLTIDVYWLIASGTTEHLKIAFSLANDRIFMKPTESSVTDVDRIPNVAYLPSFAGVQPREERLSKAIQRKLIGRGMAGATLRNILHEVHKEHLQHKETFRRNTTNKIDTRAWKATLKTDPWWQLLETLHKSFDASLTVEEFDELHETALSIFFFKGKYVNANFKKHENYKPRDIMSEGSGFLQWLSVYTLAINPHVDVLLLDEPDAHLHPTWQTELFGRLRELLAKKQILMASHSTELLKTTPPELIYWVAPRRMRYLNEDAEKKGLFIGIGSEYAPKLDRLKSTKRVIFLEGSFEESVVPELMSKTQHCWNDRWVVWHSPGDHKETWKVFAQLKEEISELKGVSIRDLDNKDIAKVGIDCVEEDFRARKDEGLLCITLRRRELENYLLSIRAIAAVTAKDETEITNFLKDRTGLAHEEDVSKADCSPGLRNAHAKEALYEGMDGKPSLEAVYRTTRHDIAKELKAEELPDDLKSIFQSITAHLVL